MKLFPTKGYIISSIAGCATALAIFKGMEMIFPMTGLEESIGKDIEILTGLPVNPANLFIKILSLLLHILFAFLGAASGWWSFKLLLKFKSLLVRE